MIKLKTLYTTPRRLRSACPSPAAGGRRAARVAAREGPRTITVGNENSADNAPLNSTTKNEPSETSTNDGPKTPTSGPLSKKLVDDPAGGPPPKKEVIKDLIVGHRRRSQSGPDGHDERRRRQRQERQGIRLLVEAERTLHVHARQETGHRRVGKRHPRDEGRRAPRTGDPAGARGTERQARRRASRRTKRWSSS